MISDQDGAMLHSRYTEGEELTKEELKILQEWYDDMDKREMKDLNLIEDTTVDNPPKVEELLEQIKLSNQQYKDILLENEKLRAEAEVLRQKIAQLYDKKRA